jgi:hypothetical protein
LQDTPADATFAINSAEAVARRSLCLLDAPQPNLYTTLRRACLRFVAPQKHKGESLMDIVFLLAAVLMFAAIVGLVIGCDKLGARQ